MRHQWVGLCADGAREELEAAIRQIDAAAHIVFARDAADIRCRLRDEVPGAYGAVVGLGSGEVSDVNLAAALASDGKAREVVLVQRFVTGSLRSRAARAGISRVIDIDDVLFDEMLEEDASVGSDCAASMRKADETPGADLRAAVHEERAGLAPVIVLSSGRGGVGKSALAAVWAVMAARWGMPVSLCDLDLACGNLPSQFGLGRWEDPTTYVKGGVFDRDLAIEAGHQLMDGLRVWGPCERPEMAEQVMPAVGELLSMLSETSGLVIVDTSSTCTDAVAQAMQQADRLVIVQGEGAGGVASIAKTSALAVRLGVARTRIVRIENRCHPRMVTVPFAPCAEVGLESARAFRVPDGGDEVGELLCSGDAGELCELGSDFVRVSASVLATLLKELGVLPDHDEARKAADRLRTRKGFALFGRRGEVA